MKVLVVDPFITGHHLLYLYYITDAFLKNGVCVVSAGNINEEFEGKFEVLSCQYDNKFSYIKLVDEHGGYCDKSSAEYTNIVKDRWLSINQLVISYENEFDFVFLPWLDSYIDGRIDGDFYDKLSFKWIGIYFQPYFLNSNIKDIKKCKFLDPSVLFGHESCIGLASLVDSTTVKEHSLFKGTSLYIVPDFSDMEIKADNDFYEEIKVKKKNRCAIGLFGSLAKRKGILQLFQTIEKFQLYDNYFFIIAGELIESDFTPSEKSEILEIIRNNNDAFFFHPERLDSEKEFNYLMSLCDIVFAVYVNFFYSSNMLIKAASLRKPLIATKNTYMGDDVEKYRLGLSVEAEPSMIYHAINEIKNNPEGIIDRDLVDQYIERKSLSELINVIGNIKIYFESKFKTA